MTRRKRLTFGILIVCLGAGLIVARSSLPSLENRSVSAALPDTTSTRLGKAISLRLREQPGKSGVHTLLNSRDAFAARVLLARAAERSLDVQYYIWHEDLSGTLLFDALRQAADRGVRVRLLLDDNNTAGLDATLAALDSHANVEVRLFNPFGLRWPRALGYLTDFFRLNRRMHNKSFTADNQATIVGGRNIGDEYFDATNGMAFVDLDVLAVGPVVEQVSTDFDGYWASDSSYPADRLLPQAGSAQIAELAARAAGMAREPAAAKYLEAVRASLFVNELTGGRLALEWTVIHVVSDDPAKGLGRAAPGALLPDKLRAVIGEPAARVELVSAYFVPGGEGTDWFRSMAARGVKIQVLTNSFEATDVAAVHAGYVKRRKPLLEAGIRLYELRRLSGGAEASRRGAPFGSSGSSLHAKTFAVDGSRVFIGSFNFDPRSAELNTEMGFVIDSSALAQKVDTAFAGRIPADAYEVRLAEGGQLYWLERRGGELLRHDVEPGTSFWERLGVTFISWLPVDWLL